jgi:hypothetical protein
MRTLAELVPLRTGICRSSGDAVSAVAAGEEGGRSRARHHVMHCLRCQAEVAAYRRVLRVMTTMRDHPLAISAIEDLAGSSDLSGMGGSPPPQWAARAACVGGITAGAAGMLWLSRRRGAGMAAYRSLNQSLRLT